MLLAASAVQAIAFAFYLPARIAFIAELVAPEQIGVAVVVSQTAQEAMRVIAPALAGVLIGVSWFGVGGVFLLAGVSSAISALFVAGLPSGAPRVVSNRSPVAEIVDAIGYVRSRRELSLVALTTIGVVVIGYPYLVFLPALADDRFDVGAGGYGLMAGVAGFGAVIAGLITPRLNWVVSRPWRVIGLSGGALGVALVALGFSSTYWLALLVLLAVGAAGLVFQTSTQALMLSLSDFQYHGRMQSMVVLGFSGFGLAALPLGLFADATSLRLTLVGMGAPGARRDRCVRRDASPAPQPARRRRAGLIRCQVAPSTPGNVATQCSAMRSFSMRCTRSHVTIESSPVSRLMPLLVARVHTRSPFTARSSITVSARDSTRWNSDSRPLYARRSARSLPVPVWRMNGSVKISSMASRLPSRHTSSHHR